jgi:hypothetical protein
MTGETVSAAAPPRLSVALVAGPCRRRAQAALDAFGRQTLVEMEVLLFDSRPEASPLAKPPGLDVREVRRDFPGGQPEARSAAVQMARAPALAFVEDHCVVAPGWAAAVAEAFETGPWGVVGYTFRNADDSRWGARGCHAAVYAPWMAPAEDAEVRGVATNNLAFRTEIVRRLGPVFERMISPDAMLQQHLLRQGVRFFLAGRAECTHENLWQLGCIAAVSAAHGRALAARRIEVWQWGWPRRLFYAAAVPVGAPLLRFWRLFAGAASRPRRWLPVLESLPVAAVTYVAGACGEAFGYLWADDRAVARLEAYELELDRS